ncbi:MAG: putative polysaccharide biosynthesis protein [Christensenellales bacterium]|jgi:stage V sporulation protein B
MSEKTASFVKGAAILAIAGIIGKIIGAFFRIPLTNTIGLRGIANYNMAYPIYSALLVISSAGLPTAIAKMVSERIAVNDYRGAHDTFKTAFRILALIGICTTLIMLLGSRFLAGLLNVDTAWMSIAAISPSLFFVSLISAYRGYFQGMQLMSPTAASQLVEQLGKLIMGLFLARQLLPYGVEYGAAGALIGVTLSEIAALVMLGGVYARKRKYIFNRIEASDTRRQRRYSGGTGKSILKQLAKIAIPITVGAAIMPLVQLIDSAIVVNALTGIGYSAKDAESLFGLLTGCVNTLVNLPAVLSLALAMSIVPAISASRTLGDTAGVRSKAATGLKIAILVGLPCAAGLFVLSTPVLKLLYTDLTVQELATASGLMSVMSLAVVFLTLVQAMTGVLQGAGHVLRPVVNLAIGAVVKIVLSIVLIRMPGVNIYGAAIGTTACYGVAALLDVVYAVRKTGIKFSVADYIIKPVLSAGVMAAIAYFIFPIAEARLGNTIATFAVIAVAAVVYFAVVLLSGALKKEDLEMIPGGNRLIKLFSRAGILK